VSLHKLLDLVAVQVKTGRRARPEARREVARERQLECVLGGAAVKFALNRSMHICTGRCACVMSAHSHPYEATRSSLAQKPVWGVVIADARLNEGRLYRIVDLLMRSLTSIGRVLLHDIGII